MKIEIRTLSKNLHEITVITDNATLVDTYYSVHLRDLKEHLEDVVDDIDYILQKG